MSSTVSVDSCSSLRSAELHRNTMAPLWPLPHDYIDVGHSQLAYYRFGRGPDLVFLHGWPLHSATFRNVVPLLSDEFTCHLIDLPGSGRTRSSDQAAIAIDAHVASLKSASRMLGLTRFALVGHDSGGGVARYWAAEEPAVVALALSNTEIPNHHARLVKVLQALCSLPGGRALLPLSMRARLVRHSALGFGECFADKRLIDGPFHDLFVAPLLADEGVAKRQLDLLMSFKATWVDGLSDIHRKIDVPTLLVWGDRDPIFPLIHAREMLGQFGGEVELQLITGGRTFVHEEQPEAFVAHAKPFLHKAFRNAL